MRTSDTASRKRTGQRQLADVARKLLTPALRRQGFAQHEIVTRWPTIVGGLLAAKSLPERLRFNGTERRGGTLFVRVESAFALEFQHLTPQILERVNTYYGYRAVEKVVIRQGVLPPQPRRPDSRPEMSEEMKKDLTMMLDGVAPGPLRDSLMRLGEHVLAPPPSSNRR